MTDIFPPNYSVTGIRSENASNTQVIMTGSCPVDIVNCPGDSQDTQSIQAMLYRGPMDGSGQYYPLIPDIGKTVCSSIFYGPNTHYFNPKLIEEGQVRAVGTYKYQGDPLGDATHGMMYEGPLTLNGTGGTWTPIDMPAHVVGGGKVINTIPHSTMGELIVGNYERVYIEQGAERHEFGAFIYHINAPEESKYRKLTLGSYKLVTAYGIWQNGNATTSYTIAGGLDKEGNGINVGYLVDYVSGTLGQPTTFVYSKDSNLITHFEGITNLERGMPESAPNRYSLAATGDQDRENRGAAFAVVERLPNGSFGQNPRWEPVPAPSGASANTVLTNNVFGVYLTGDRNNKSIQSYWASNL